ncbi:MAG: Notchless protein 1 [Marteilia pararefringens]
MADLLVNDLHAKDPAPVESADAGRQILAKLLNSADHSISFSLQLSVKCDVEQLRTICNELRKQHSAKSKGNFDEDDDDDAAYKFFINNTEIDEDIFTTLNSMCNKSQTIHDLFKKYNEDVLVIEYKRTSNFRVQFATRCSNTNDGHDESIIDVKYSPSGKYIATGSGDCTVRIWNSCMNTSLNPSQGHGGWIMFIDWSPDEAFLASGCQKGQVIFWTNDGSLYYKPKNSHSAWISCLCWRPLHLELKSSKFAASSSKDGSVCIYDLESLAIHHRFYTKKDTAINYVKWSGNDHIIGASKDTNIYIWNFNSKTLTHKLSEHSHWINCIAINADFLFRTGAFDPRRHIEPEKFENIEDSLSGTKSIEIARGLYKKFISDNRQEIFATCSDDRTICLWSISSASDGESKSKIELISRLTGHQGTVIQIVFSPDGTYLASASFDKSIRIWNAHNGALISILRGHIAPIYQIYWSPDSHYLISGSADSTVKIWSRKAYTKGAEKKKIKSHLQRDLPGHEDEIFCVDWSPDGSACASGGKDRHLKIWK